MIPEPSEQPRSVCRSYLQPPYFIIALDEDEKEIGPSGLWRKVGGKISLWTYLLIHLKILTFQASQCHSFSSSGSPVDTGGCGVGFLSNCYWIKGNYLDGTWKSDLTKNQNVIFKYDFWHRGHWYLKPGWGYQNKDNEIYLHPTASGGPGSSGPRGPWVGRLRRPPTWVRMSDGPLGEARPPRARCGGHPQAWDWRRWGPRRMTGIFLLIQMTLKHRYYLCPYIIERRAGGSPKCIYRVQWGYVPAVLSSGLISAWRDR